MILGNTPGTDAIIVTAYSGTNGSGALLGTESILACSASAWSGNFLGIETSNGSPIKSIGIDYSTNNDAGNPAVANLMFVPAAVAWSGTASTASWSSSANWTPSVTPAGGSTTIFPSISGKSTLAVSLSGAQSADGLAFSSTSTSYTISGTGTGSSLTLGSGSTLAAITCTGSIGNTVSACISLGNNLTANLAQSSTLTISGNISGTGSGTQALTETGSGTLVLSGSNSYAGGTTVSGGTLVLTSASALSSAGNLVVSDGGQVILNSNLASETPQTSEPSLSLLNSSEWSALAANASANAQLTAGLDSGAATISEPPAASSSLGMVMLNGGNAVSAVPEPGTMVLLVAGSLCGLAVWWKRRPAKR
jgi:autotransporter-associated beta strand protein